MKPASESKHAYSSCNEEFIKRFCDTRRLISTTEISAPDKAMTAIVTGAELYLPLSWST